VESQKNFYFLYRSQGKHAFVYNVPLVLEISGPIDCEVLSKSLRFLVERHEVLRTIFYETSEGLIQEVIEKHSG